MNPKNKIYITASVIIIVFALLVAFVIFPLWNGVKNNAAAITAAKEETLSINDEIDSLGTLKKQYQDYSTNLDKINHMFVNLEVPIDFINYLEGIASDSAVTLNVVSASKTVEGGQPMIIFQLSVKGPYEYFARFLDKTENSPYLLGVQSMNIQSFPAGEPNQDVDANVTIKVLAK